MVQQQEIMKYQVSPVATKETLQLQSVGHVIGEPAINVKTGDFLLWNFGISEQVIGMGKETKHFVTAIFKGGQRKLKKDRLVCILKD